MTARQALLASLLCMPTAAKCELSLSFPGPSSLSASQSASFTNYELPIGPYSDGSIPTVIAEGTLARTAWRIAMRPPSTLSISDSLRQQIEAKGFELLFECATRKCGGFDFRFGLEVLPEPEMHVDLGDFRFLSAQRLGGPVPEYLGLLISRSSDNAYVQITYVGYEQGATVSFNTDTPAGREVVAPLSGTIGERLKSDGASTLEDLIFETGSSELGAGEFGSLQDLAEFLKSDPTLRVALVGHTDAEGSLEGNIALSRKRAESVRQRLISVYGVPESQLSAEGVGFLAPRASNETDEGRAKNRRVEAVLASTR